MQADDSRILRPTPEEQQVVLLDVETLRKAERLIESCEAAIHKPARFPSITSLIGLQVPIPA
jgi:hypothetical protein